MSAFPGTAETTAAAMAEAARRFLDLLDDGLRQRAAFGFPGEPERSRWFYVPTDHGGLTLGGVHPSAGPSGTAAAGHRAQPGRIRHGHGDHEP